jgi:hypothetical protein
MGSRFNNNYRHRIIRRVAMSSFKTAAITAENTFTHPLGVGPARGFNLSIWGTFSAIVTLQRSFDAGTTWLDVATYAGPIEDRGVEPEGALYRVGVKTGGHASGTVNVRLGA